MLWIDPTISNTSVHYQILLNVSCAIRKILVQVILNPNATVDSLHVPDGYKLLSMPTGVLSYKHGVTMRIIEGGVEAYIKDLSITSDGLFILLHLKIVQDYKIKHTLQLTIRRDGL